MGSSDQVDSVSEETATTLADEIGSRLKKDIGAEVGELLDGFFGEMKASRQKILLDSDTRQDRILKLLDEQTSA